MAAAGSGLADSHSVIIYSKPQKIVSWRVLICAHLYLFLFFIFDNIRIDNFYRASQCHCLWFDDWKTITNHDGHLLKGLLQWELLRYRRSIRIKVFILAESSPSALFSS